MSDLPEPLVPPDCDVRGFGFMPLDVVRLLDSDLFALTTGDEFKAAVALWCKSWLQVPASSVPDDDRVLAHLSGSGLRWKKVKAMALRGWVKAADGRLYHPVVASKALEAWNRKQSQREKANKRWGNAGAPKDPSGGNPEPVPPDMPPDQSGNAAACASAMQQTGTETKREESKQLREPERDASARLVHQPSPARSDPPERWVHLADRLPDGSPDLQREEFPEHLVEAAKRHGRTLPPRDPEEVGRPRVAGWHINVAADLVCQAAGINDANWRGDWRPLIGWLRDGFDLHEAILPTIQAVAGRPSYRPPASLAYFDRAVREQRVAA